MNQEIWGFEIWTTSNLIDNKIADKITTVSKKKSINKNNDNNNDDVELTTHKKNSKLLMNSG